MENLWSIERIRFTSDDGLSFILYKLGKIIICTGTYIAKSNYTYNKLIPEGFKPKDDTYLVAQYAGYTEGISTTTIHFLSDGTIKTKDPYRNQLSTGLVVWETK